MEKETIKLYDGYYREFIEKTSYMIFISDESGYLFHVNEAWKLALGYPVDMCANHILWDFVHPYSRSLCQDNFKQANPGESFDLEVVFIAYDHSLVYAEGKFNCSYDALNQIKIVTGIVQDVTLQNQQALEIECIKYYFEEKSRYWEMIQKAYMTLSNEAINHFDDNIISVLKHFGRMVYADRAFIIKYDMDTQKSSTLYEWCNRGIAPKKNHFMDIPFSDMEDWIKANSAGTHYYVSDILSMPQDSRIRKRLEPNGVMSMIAVPMMQDGKCFGCVGFDSVKVHRTDTELEIQILNDLGTLFLYTIKRRKKYLSWQDRKMRLESYLENAPVAIVVCDGKGVIHEINSTACTLTGHLHKTLIGKKIKALVVEDLTVPLRDCLEKNQKSQLCLTLRTDLGESITCTCQLSKANDSEVILMITI